MEYLIIGCAFGFSIVIGVKTFLDVRKMKVKALLDQKAEEAKRKSELLARLGFPEN